MRKSLVAFLLLLPLQAHAQQALVVSSCGTPPTTYSAGQTRLPTVDTTGKLCLSSSGAATPGGSDTQVQFNDSGALAGATSLTVNKTTGVVTAASGLTIGAGSAITSSGPGGALASGAYASAAAAANPTATATSSAVNGSAATFMRSDAAPAVAATTINGTSCSPGGSCTIAPSVTSAVVSTTYNMTTASGTQTVSGFGFTPTSCLGFGAVNGATTLSNTVYNAFVESNLAQGSIYAGAGGVTQSGANFFIVQDVAGTNYQAAVVSSFASNQLVLTWTKAASPTGTFSFSIKCFK